MATKYELASELRALTKGMRPLPISKMKKDELLKAIASAKQIKAEQEVTVVEKVKPGPLPPRPTKVEPVKIDSDFIKAPKLPIARMLGPKPKVEVIAPKGLVASEKGLGLRRVITLGADDGDRHKCNCCNCPTNYEN